MERYRGSLALDMHDVIPCTRCGECCQASLCCCAEDMALQGAVAPCPALSFEEGKAVCGLVLMEIHITGGDAIRTTLGIGRGCTNYDCVRENPSRSGDGMKARGFS